MISKQHVLIGVLLGFDDNEQALHSAGISEILKAHNQYQSGNYAEAIDMFSEAIKEYLIMIMPLLCGLSR